MTPDIKRILVPLDFSVNSNRALEYAADLIVMGTHGAVTHLGNVARKLAIAAATVLMAVLLSPSTASAQEQPMQQATTGGAVFGSYCASCHGTTARGDGPLAATMRRKPANLTEIAKRNGGEFPSAIVYRTIDGRQPVRGHGGPDMPEWGAAFEKSSEAGDADRVRRVIQSLVDYLASIQVRAAPDQQ